MTLKLLTPKEVSLLTGVKQGTLAHWRSQKKHIPYLKVGVFAMYDRADVEQYLETCRVSVRKDR